MGSSFSKDLDILCGVRQGSKLCTLLFSIDIYDLFFIDMSSDITDDADDTILELNIYTIFNWFKYNHFKASTTKCHFWLIALSVCYHKH